MHYIATDICSTCKWDTALMDKIMQIIYIYTHTYICIYMYALHSNRYLFYLQMGHCPDGQNHAYKMRNHMYLGQRIEPCRHLLSV